jgi:hypothetical protein
MGLVFHIDPIGYHVDPAVSSRRLPSPTLSQVPGSASCILHCASLKGRVDRSVIGAIRGVTRIQSSEGPLQRLAPVVCQLEAAPQSTQAVSLPTRRGPVTATRKHALRALLPRIPRLWRLATKALRQRLRLAPTCFARLRRAGPERLMIRSLTHPSGTSNMDSLASRHTGSTLPDNAKSSSSPRPGPSTVGTAS